jgi:inosine/xanthosine triphosphate pyrophosphatase family protein
VNVGIVVSEYKRILLATKNLAKQRWLSWLFDGSGVVCISPDQVCMTTPEIWENGSSHEDNASRKAIAWSDAFGGLAISSDGGLVVPALEMSWNSLLTRRFSLTDDIQRAKDLLGLMKPLAWEQRLAHCVEAVAIANDGRLLDCLSEESGSGYIARDISIDLIQDGFWVSGVWQFPEFHKFYGELTEFELKQVGDHWTRLKDRILQWFS